MLPAFVPPEGTRFPRGGDEFKAFSPPPFFRGRLSFGDILRFHAPETRAFTLLRTVQAELAGAMCFVLRDIDVFIEYLMRNEGLSTPRVLVGSVLLGAAQCFAAAHARPFVRLDAVNERGLIEWYIARGFVVEGSAREDPGWGAVVPMFKIVERGASGTL